MKVTPNKRYFTAYCKANERNRLLVVAVACLTTLLFLSISYTVILDLQVIRLSEVVQRY